LAQEDMEYYGILFVAYSVAMDSSRATKTLEKMRSMDSTIDQKILDLKRQDPVLWGYITKATGLR